MMTIACRRWRTMAAGLVLTLVAMGAAHGQEPAATETTTAEGRTRRTLKLPAAVEDVVVAGSGKYLVAHLKSVHKLAVIDVKEAKVVKYLTAPADALFAGSADKLYIVLKDQAIIQRWNLDKLERELATPLPSGVLPANLTVGHAALGPILLGAGNDFYGGGGYTLLDAKTLQPLPANQRENGRGFECYAGCVVRVSAGGQVFTSWRPGISPSGFFTLVFSGGKAETHYDHESRGLLLPSADGTRIYTNDGVFNNKTGAIAATDPQNRTPSTLLPSATGDYYLSVTPPDWGYSHDERKSSTIGVHLTGDSRPIVTLANLIPPRPERGFGGDQPLSIDKRLFHFPDLSVLAYLPHPYEALEFLTLDLDAELAKSDVDYLFFNSRPPLSLDAGKSLDYQAVVKSKKGSAKVSLAAGPEGMQVTPAGKVTWTPPIDAAGEHDVILAVSDASGQEVFQTFRLTVNKGIAPTVTSPAAAIPAATKTASRPAAPTTTVPATTSAASAGSQAAAGSATTAGGKVTPITPAKLTGDKMLVKLPAAAEQVEIGGSGRYLILHLKSLRKLAVLDLCEAKVSGYIPAEDDSVAFAAGAEKLVLALGDKQILTRWNLATRERELAVPAEGPISEVVIGSASAGPVLVLGGADRSDGRGYKFLDLTKLNPLEVAEAQNGYPVEARGMSARVSADGRTFCMPGSFGMSVFLFDGQKIRPQQGSHEGGHAMGIPSPDGQVIYCGLARYSPQMRLLSGQQNQYGLLIPAAQGRFYLAVQVGDQFRHDGGQIKHKVGVHIEGDSRPLITLDDFNLFASGGGDIYASGHAGIPTDKRIVLVPDAKVIAALTPTFDGVELRRFDLDEALEAAGIDYLFVTSRPPATAKPGEAVSYQLQVKSKKGGVTYRLETGPDGMKLSQQGLLAWQVPADAPASSQSVIVAVGDSAGQEVFHTFQIAVQGAEPPPTRPAGDSPLNPLTRLLSGAVRGVPMPQELRPLEPAPQPGAGEAVVPTLPAGTIPTRPAADADPFQPAAQPASLKPPASLVGQSRTWTDSASGRTLEATFLGLTDGKLKAVTKAGKEVEIALSRLSREDLLWLLGGEASEK